MLALAWPLAAEVPQHDIWPWRVRGKIFATVPDDDHIRVMLDEEGIRAAVAEYPHCCAEVHWGGRLACVVVDLKAVPRQLVRELLTDAWLRKAPGSHQAKPGE
jgi:hypothetical protein